MDGATIRDIVNQVVLEVVLEIQPLLIKVVALAATTATKQVMPVSSLMRIQPTAPMQPLIALCLQLCSDL